MSMDCASTPTDAPSAWVVRFAHLIAPKGRVLDLACGAGRHARWLAARGWNVVATDRDAACIEGLHGVDGIAACRVDLESEAWPFAGESFDGIVVVNYLHRPLLPCLAAALAPAGALLYETFAHGNAAFGRPVNPDFLLSPGELLEAFESSTIPIAFEQGRVDGPQRSAVVQRLAAVGRSRQWPLPLASCANPLAAEDE